MFRVLGATLLLATGVLIGVVMTPNDPDGSAATQARLERAEGIAQERADTANSTRAELRRLRQELDAARRISAESARTTARLRRDLRRAERAGRRASRSRSR